MIQIDVRTELIYGFFLILLIIRTLIFQWMAGDIDKLWLLYPEHLVIALSGFWDTNVQN